MCVSERERVESESKFMCECVRFSDTTMAWTYSTAGTYFSVVLQFHHHVLPRFPFSLHMYVLAFLNYFFAFDIFDIFFVHRLKGILIQARGDMC